MSLPLSNATSLSVLLLLMRRSEEVSLECGLGGGNGTESQPLPQGEVLTWWRWRGDSVSLLSAGRGIVVWGQGKR